jgi:hypothetical protein
MMRVIADLTGLVAEGLRRLSGPSRVILAVLVWSYLLLGAGGREAAASLAFSETKVTASDADQNDEFGRAVSVTGSMLAVGARGEAADRGAAYVHERDEGGPENWGEVAKLTASDAAEGDGFGWSVSIRSDTAVVGAPGDDEARGAAYIFRRDQDGPDNWGQVTKLFDPNSAPGDYFGTSVSISGNTIVVGAYRSSDGSLFSGSAYVFDRNEGGLDNWGQVARLTASDGALLDYFGVSVAISVNTVLVGAYGDNGGAGSAYVFERDEGGPDNWGEVTKLTPADGAAGDAFGFSVSISGDRGVVGAYEDDGSIGSAYIFERDEGGPDNWGEVTKLTAADGAAGDAFGFSVSISAARVVVGASGDSDVGTSSGSSYVFEGDEGGPGNWGEAAKLTAFDAAQTDYFGAAVSVSGGTLVSGAYGDEDAGSSSGSAYAYSLLPSVCGDANDDAVVGSLDVDTLRDFLVDPIGSPLSPAGQSKCSVIGGATDCYIDDVVVLRRFLASTVLLPGIDPVCAASGP